MGCAFWDEMTYSDIHMCTVPFSLFPPFSVSFHISIPYIIKGYKILLFCPDTLLLISCSHFPLLLICLWIHNMGPVINVRILQPNSRHLGLLHMNAITPSAVIRPLSCTPSPHLCHSPLYLQEDIYFLYLSTVFLD